MVESRASRPVTSAWCGWRDCAGPIGQSEGVCGCALCPAGSPPRAEKWCSDLSFQMQPVGTVQKMDRREAGTEAGGRLGSFLRTVVAWVVIWLWSDSCGDGEKYVV